jgi:hypothetical protein
MGCNVQGFLKYRDDKAPPFREIHTNTEIFKEVSQQGFPQIQKHRYCNGPLGRDRIL